MDQTIHSKVMDFQRSDLHPLWASWVGNLQAQNGCQHGELSIHFVHRVSHFFLFVQNFTFVFKYNMDILILHKFWDEFCWFIVYFCLKGTKCEILCTKWKESSPCWQPFCACRLPTQGAHAWGPWSVNQIFENCKQLSRPLILQTCTFYSVPYTHACLKLLPIIIIN